MRLAITIYITGICYVYGILSYPRLRFYFALRQCKYKGPLPLRYCTLLVLYLMHSINTVTRIPGYC